jgi:hypothetical protein
MPELLPGQTKETDTPTFTVTVDPNNPLPAGTMQFQLVVVDDAQNESAPAQVVVHVIDNVRPTAILSAPAMVPVGQGFMLNGSQSTDIGGTIVTYRWTRVM